MRVTRLVGTALAVAVALAAAGCSAESRQNPRFEKYVALGDSFTAGPFVPTTDLASGCFRSDGNYPSLLAERLGVVDFIDVSCSGAQTSDLVRRQETVADARVPPQLDAVDPDTDLVTLGIGGNDFHLFSTLVHTCSRLSAAGASGSPCFDELEARGVDLLAATRKISDRVAESARRVLDRAPEATVVLVGYPRLAPPSGSCPPTLPFSTGDAEMGDRVTRALNDALEDAARRTGARFVDMYAASKGHDICADDPWVNGRHTDRGAALAFHPFPAGMEAAAEAIAARL
ncbi:MAG: SGNH/GDSL hydrolase family protein [Nocardioidaceae bacterium]